MEEFDFGCIMFEVRGSLEIVRQILKIALNNILTWNSGKKFELEIKNWESLSDGYFWSHESCEIAQECLT